MSSMFPYAHFGSKNKNSGLYGKDKKRFDIFYP